MTTGRYVVAVPTDIPLPADTVRWALHVGLMRLHRAGHLGVVTVVDRCQVTPYDDDWGAWPGWSTPKCPLTEGGEHDAEAVRGPGGPVRLRVGRTTAWVRRYRVVVAPIAAMLALAALLALQIPVVLAAVDVAVVAVATPSAATTTRKECPLTSRTDRTGVQPPGGQLGGWRRSGSARTARSCRTPARPAGRPWW